MESPYRNAGIYTKKKGIFQRRDVDPFDAGELNELQVMANDLKETVYVLREFIANDSEYQEKPPNRLATDWFVLEVKPEQ